VSGSNVERYTSDGAWRGMGQTCASRSISRSLWERFQHDGVDGRVLAVFERSCIVGMSEGDLACLVLPELGDGPLNVVVDFDRAALAGVQPGMPVHSARAEWSVGPLRIDLRRALVWEPCPNWPAMRKRGPVSLERLLRLRRLAADLAPPESLLSVLACVPSKRPSDSAPCTFGSRVALEVLNAAKELALGWAGDVPALRAGALRLAGLGGGLTPSGDDFLVGVMLKAWLVHHDPRRLCRHIVDTAAPRTTALSAAFLRSAGRGECSPAWHALLARQGAAEPHALRQAAREVMAYGATSGADALAGFLWGGTA
jgi:hypothetical protein